MKYIISYPEKIKRGKKNGVSGSGSEHILGRPGSALTGTTLQAQSKPSFFRPFMCCVTYFLKLPGGPSISSPTTPLGTSPRSLLKSGQ